MFDINKIDAVIASNNEKLLKDKKVYPREIKDESGNVLYTQNYVGETWKIEKVRGRNGAYYQLVKTITDLKGKSVVIKNILNDSQVQYLNYQKNNMLENISFNTSTSVAVKTRFVYGFNEKNRPYVLCLTNLADRIVLKSFVDPLIAEILALGFSDSSTAFNIIMEKKNKLEELADDEIEFL